jgi:hypothetical protein
MTQALYAHMNNKRKKNWMALYILTAAQGGICTVIKTECCVYIPDKSAKTYTPK